MHASSFYALSALSIALVNAAPLNKREVVWVTETDVAVVTVPVTKTVWAAAPTDSADVNHRRPFSQTTIVTSSVSTASASVYSITVSENSTSVAPSTTSSSSVSVAPTTTSTSIYVAPTTTSTSVAVAPTTSTSASVAPTTSTSVYVAPTTSTSVYVAPTTTSTSVYVAPTTTTSSTSVYVAPTTTSSTAAAATTTSSSSGATGGSGDLTYYSAGLGSCGVTNSDSDAIVALAIDMMAAGNGANPNNNPICGKSIVINWGGISKTAKIMDTCAGCSGGSLDLTPSLFEAFSPLSAGRLTGMTWTYA